LPLVPAKAGTQIESSEQAALGSRLRGNEREQPDVHFAFTEEQQAFADNVRRFALARLENDA